MLDASSVSRHKQFCKHGHDTWVTGRYAGSGCRVCVNEKALAWRARNPEKRKAIAKRHYAKQSDRYLAKSKAWKRANPERAQEHTRRASRKRQGIEGAPAERRSGVCPILGCGRSGLLVPDHNHATGALRGWICSYCNRALGFAKDSSCILRALAVYLES